MHVRPAEACLARVLACVMCAWVCVGLGCAAAAKGQGLAVERRSTVLLPAATVDQHGEAFTIAGLSGIAYAGEVEGGDSGGAVHRFVAVMDNSNKLVLIEATFAADGAIGGVVVTGGLSLAESADFEDVAVVPGGERVLVCEEGTPGVRVFSMLDGAAMGELPTPAVFAHRRPNFGFEALCAAGGRVWTGNEEALTVDGAAATQGAGTVVRLLRFEQVAGAYIAGVQHAYRCEPLHGAAINGARSGLVAMVVLPSGRLLALERSFALNFGGLFRSRVFEVGVDGATDVSALDALDEAGYVPATKRLVWSGNANNLEGLCVGPALAEGGRVLVGVVDNGDPLSASALVSFRVTGPTEGECVADADGNGAVEVPDVFAFLSWWFGGDARADIDGAAGLGVPDIFAFLGVWFAGCA